MTKTKSIFANIVCMAVPVKRYWKTIWKIVSYTGRKKSSSQKLATRRGVTKSNIRKTVSYVYLLSSTRISKAHYVNKMNMSHLHENPSPPNANIRYHVGDASAWRTMCITASGNILASGNISLKLFMAPLETIELLTFWYVVAEHHFTQL